MEAGSMNRMIVRLLMLSLCVLPASALAQEAAPDTTAGLEAEYSMQTGDYAAVLLPEFLRIRTDLAYPVVVTYEPEPNRLDVEVFGPTATVEQARYVIGLYWDFIQAYFFPYAERRLGVTLEEGDFAIVYYDTSRAEWMKPLVQMVEGQYVIQ
jgi:hypothetical protein